MYLQKDAPEAASLASYKTIRDTTLIALHARIVAERVASLQRSESANLCIDGWDGSPEQGRLVGVSYCWVDDTWHRRTAFLDLLEVASSHTGTESLASTPSSVSA